MQERERERKSVCGSEKKIVVNRNKLIKILVTTRDTQHMLPIHVCMVFFANEYAHELVQAYLCVCMCVCVLLRVCSLNLEIWAIN